MFTLGGGWSDLKRAWQLKGIRFLRRHRPVRDYAVVAGWPDVENNALAMLLALSERGIATFWLVDRPEAAQYFWFRSEVCRGKRPPHIVPRSSLRAVWIFSAAKWCYFTHGLYGRQEKVPGKLLINLWHGDGPKMYPRRPRQEEVFADAILCASKTFWQAKRDIASDAALRIDVGNPRCDFLRKHPAGLGVESTTDDKVGSTVPFVVAMPTYRKAKRVQHRPGWRDVENEESSEQLADRLRLLSETLTIHGLRLVIKPHPLDDYPWEMVTGIDIMTEAELARTATPLYAWLSDAQALVTDFSSVWVDWLSTDKPIAFFLEDYDEFNESRGLVKGNWVQYLPGPRLNTLSDIQSFVASVSEGKVDIGRMESAKRFLRYSQQGDCANRVLDITLSM